MTTAEQTVGATTDIDVALEMEESFLAYSMSVLSSRAIPDVRDGLKPVQRRILYAMLRTGMRPDRSYGKSAGAVGEVIKNYHPHGDSAIYEALVRMAQPWAMRVPLIDGHGNFGSLDDGPAAMRYTECRLAPAAMEMLADIDEGTVDFVPNFDDSTTEPSVLPAGLPNLLVNGVNGIAVGMRTNLPPHNPGEVANALTHLVHHPDATVDDLLEHLPGPDYPSGATVVGAAELAEAYRTGKGNFRVRGVAEVADFGPRRRGILITALPHMVGPERVISDLQKAIQEERISGVAGVRDASDHKHGMQLKVEAKTGINPEALLEQLYQHTALETTDTIDAVALVEGQPQQLDLKAMLQHYLDHRHEVLLRRTRHRRANAADRAHLLEGLMVALADLDEVIAIIRGAADTPTARTQLLERFDLDESQVEFILELQLRRLSQMEVNKVEEELAELRERIADLDDLLADEDRQRLVIAEQITDAAARHGDERRTALRRDRPAGPKAAQLTEPDNACAVALTATGLLARCPTGDDGTPAALATGNAARRDDLIVADVAATNHSVLLVVTDKGRGHYLDALEIPNTEMGSPPGPATEFVDLAADEHIVGLVDLGTKRRNVDGLTIALVTTDGRVKRLAADKLTQRGPVDLIATNGETVVAAAGARDDDHIVLVTSAARMLKLDAGKIRPQGRSGSGVSGMNLDGASVVGVGVASGGDGAVLLTAADGGKVKLTDVDEYPLKGRGGRGVRCHNLTSKDTQLVAARVVHRGSPYALTEKNRVKEVPSHRGGRDASGRSLGVGVTDAGVLYRRS